MSKLKILFITKNHAQQVEKSSYYLALELAKRTNLCLWDEKGHIQSILKQLPFQPDFILINDFKPDYSPIIRGLRFVDIPVGIIMHDLHYKKERRRQFIKKENIPHIFTIYRDAFLKWYPEYADRMIWFPHHVPVDIFKDYKLPKSTNWLMMGINIEHLYPLRAKMIRSLQNKRGFVYHTHPGYRTVKKREKTAFVGESYARELNRAKMFLTCDSIYHFPLLKYYEALACRTLLLAPSSKELSDLGYENGKTFVAVDETNFQEAADYYLHHEQERKNITNKGFQMVRQKHSTEKRAKEMIGNIERIVRKKGNI